MMGLDPTLQLYAVRRTALGTRSRVMTVQLLGGGAEGGDQTAETIDGAEVLQPMGLFSRPFLTTRTEAIGVEIGDEVWVLYLLDKGGGGGTQTTFTDVEEGETRLYGAKEAAARIRCRTNGDLEVECLPNRRISLLHSTGARIQIDTNGAIQVDSAAGENLVLNAGLFRVARENDRVNIGTLTGVAGPFPLQLTATFGVGPAPPAPSPPLSPTVLLAGVIGTGEGAPRTRG